jgi:predicted GNAT superfamily acetyltransferase
MPPDIVVRKCEKLEEFHRCVDIQREIWNESDLQTEPYVTFVVASQTGGQVLGAFDGATMVGFTLGLVGLREGTPYLHSHMTGVLASHRDRHVGRHLKLFQREEALRRGIRHVEWTFDALETRNAHFNFNRLGAICRKCIPNCYGVTTSPLHRGLPTDRLLLDWQLDSKRVVAAMNELVRDPVDGPVTIHLPAELEQWKLDNPKRLEAEQTRVREEFLYWFGKGYAVTGIRFTLTGADYCLAPWSDF